MTIATTMVKETTTTKAMRTTLILALDLPPMVLKILPEPILPMLITTLQLVQQKRPTSPLLRKRMLLCKPQGNKLAKAFIFGINVEVRLQ